LAATTRPSSPTIQPLAPHLESRMGCNAAAWPSRSCPTSPRLPADLPLALPLLGGSRTTQHAHPAIIILPWRGEGVRCRRWAGIGWFGMGWDGQGEGGLQESAGWTGWARVADRARLPLAARCDRCDRGKSTWQRPRCPVFCSFTHTQYHILALNPAGHTSHRGAPSHLLSRFVHIPSAILRCRSCAVPSHY
jgi:hypothetical protein